MGVTVRRTISAVAQTLPANRCEIPRESIAVAAVWRKLCSPRDAATHVSRSALPVQWFSPSPRTSLVAWY
jgi:hypothetical protein